MLPLDTLLQRAIWTAADTEQLETLYQAWEVLVEKKLIADYREKPLSKLHLLALMHLIAYNVTTDSNGVTGYEITENGEHATVGDQKLLDMLVDRGFAERSKQNLTYCVTDFGLDWIENSTDNAIRFLARGESDG